MFIDYEYDPWVDGEPQQYRYKIIDDDFEETGTGDAEMMSIERKIIDCYTRRGLSVAPNLIRCMLKSREKYDWSLDWQVERMKASHPMHWHEIEKDMQMYLLFS
jgi:hypothetical protein